MKEKILSAVKSGIEVIRQLAEPQAVHFMEKGSRIIAECFLKGSKVLTAGNGGSLCDATHFAEELTGFFRKKRKALPAMSLSEPGHLTCVGNDAGFEHVFSRAIEAFGKEGDLFIGLTTSGNSPNMILAFERAKELGLTTIAFLGKGGGKLKGIADLEWIVHGSSTSDRIQEAHMLAIHIMIEMVEYILFDETKKEIVEEFLVSAGR